MTETACAHVASLRCAVAPAKALRFLADGHQLGRWALGSMRTERVGRGLYRGQSLFDGSSSLIRPVVDRERLQIDYWVGQDPKALKPRIVARVVPLGHDDPRQARACIVSLIAWRTEGLGDDRWARLVACHEAEIHLIRALLESPPSTPTKSPR